MFGFFKKRSPEPQKPDLATVDSRAKAEALHRAGLLDKLLMRPVELGGDDNPLNAVFVPPGIVKRKSDIDLQVIQPLAAQGRITKYAANVEYQGTSVIPIAIKITASNPETYCFTLNIWGTAIEREQREWDEVYAAREALYAEHFGKIEGNVQKLMNLTGVWPGGCLVQIQAAAHQVWVTSSFGLTNSDMPATTRTEQFEVKNADGNVQYSMRIVGRPPAPIPAGLAGYGYEIVLFTRQKEQWPLMFLNWAVQAEILSDFGILRRVHKHGALTLEDISLGSGQSADFLVAPLRQFAPDKATLPNGSIELLAATLITRPQMQVGIEQGGKALLEQIMAKPQGQASD